VTLGEGIVPKPVGSSRRYMPGLDGLRAIAVLAVIAYHLNPAWAPGGLLGVGVFFTLSGYLITDLLLGPRAATGSLRLGDFWLRRARRLLPALFLMLAVVVAWVTLLDRSLLPGLRGDVLAALGYVSNWWNIVREASYFARFGPPPPLDHLWSLAVEEQFYPDLALVALARPALRPGALRSGRADPCWCGPLSRRYGPDLPARRRPDEGLRRNRRPRLRKAASPTVSSCNTVAYLGDSTSEGMVLPSYLPNPDHRLVAQYARVGATSQYLEISGARSIVETLSESQASGYALARDLKANGFRGCWVIALGSNDTANVYVGSMVGLEARIKRMMRVIGDQPVLWITVKSLLDTGPYSQANMQDWNLIVVDACAMYPNMRVFDWDSRKRAGISRTEPTTPRRAQGTALACPRTAWPTPSPPRERVRIASSGSLWWVARSRRGCYKGL
jgi:Acyltransferase family